MFAQSYCHFNVLWVVRLSEKCAGQWKHMQLLQQRKCNKKQKHWADIMADFLLYVNWESDFRVTILHEIVKPWWTFDKRVNSEFSFLFMLHFSFNQGENFIFDQESLRALFHAPPFTIFPFLSSAAWYKLLFISTQRQRWSAISCWEVFWQWKFQRFWIPWIYTSNWRIYDINTSDKIPGSLLTHQSLSGEL